MSSFHGCMRIIKDGSNRIIEKGKDCLCPTTSPFWKKAVDILFKVSTRSQENKKELVKRADFNRYCKQRGREDIRRWLEADGQDVYFLRESDTFFVNASDLVYNFYCK